MKFPFWPEMSGYRNIEFGLKRVYDLLERIGNPHLNLPPVIHAAGTNGKGSTLAFLQAILEENNYLVHKYISPHLVNFNERIVIAGKEIEDDFLNECLLICKKASEKSPKIAVTYFEGITVAAFLAFSLKKADILLLETGMGGELDATNVLSQVLCSIITPISFDHQGFLGNSIEQIASAKAGIIKKNCSVVSIQNDEKALEVITKTAKNLNSPLKIIKNNKDNFQNCDFLIKNEENSQFWHLIDKNSQERYVFLKPNLIGDHQLQNASLAIVALLSQKYFKINQSLISKALSKAQWPARLQKIYSGKFYQKLPKNCEIYLDGSHNIAGAETIDDFLSKQKGKKIIVIMAMLNDKDCSQFIKVIASKIDFFISCEIFDEEKSLKSQEIAKIAKERGVLNVKISQNLEQVFKIITEQEINEDYLVLVCGSLYFAGEFLLKNYNNSIN